MRMNLKSGFLDPGTLMHSENDSKGPKGPSQSRKQSIVLQEGDQIYGTPSIALVRESPADAATLERLALQKVQYDDEVLHGRRTSRRASLQVDYLRQVVAEPPPSRRSRASDVAQAMAYSHSTQSGDDEIYAVSRSLEVSDGNVSDESSTSGIDCSSFAFAGLTDTIRIHRARMKEASVAFGGSASTNSSTRTSPKIGRRGSIQAMDLTAAKMRPKQHHLQPLENCNLYTDTGEATLQPLMDDGRIVSSIPLPAIGKRGSESSPLVGRKPLGPREEVEKEMTTEFLERDYHDPFSKLKLPGIYNSQPDLSSPVLYESPRQLPKPLGQRRSSLQPSFAFEQEESSQAAEKQWRRSAKPRRSSLKPSSIARRNSGGQLPSEHLSDQAAAANLGPTQYNAHKQLRHVQISDDERFHSFSSREESNDDNGIEDEDSPIGLQQMPAHKTSSFESGLILNPRRSSDSDDDPTPTPVRLDIRMHIRGEGPANAGKRVVCSNPSPLYRSKSNHQF